MILAEATHYAAPTHPCWGVQAIGWQQTTRFMPWCFDGRVVHWLNACETRNEAHAVARELAARTPVAQ